MPAKTYDARSKDLNKRVAELYAQGLNSQQIAKQIGLSVGSTANRINNLGLSPRPAPRIRGAEKKPEFMSKDVVTPIKRTAGPVKVPTFRPLTAAERVAMEARRKALIFAMGSSPTPEQRWELSTIVLTLDSDAFARSAMRAAA